MVNRITLQTMQRATLANLQQNMTAMSRLQNKYSGGKNITRASDDPSGTADLMRLGSDRRTTLQYQRNADDGTGWLTSLDSAITGSMDALRSARDLTVQGSSAGAMGQTQRDALATQIESVRATLLDQANATYLGRSVFAGTSDAGKAFDTTYTFTGTAGSSVSRQVGDATNVRVDADGSAVYGQGSSSVFALLDQVAADLRAGTPTTGRLDQIDQVMARFTAAAADIGARTNQMEAAQAQAASRLQTITGQISSVQDVDLPTVMVQVQMQQVAYQGALNAASKSLTPTLLDFLK